MSTLNKEELLKMSVKSIQLIDIKSMEDEALIQEVLNEKMVDAPVASPFKRELVPDIKSPEDEKAWQEKIDAFENGQKPAEVQVMAAEKELETLQSELESLPPVVTIQEPAAEETTPVVEETFPCGLCDKSFSRTNDLKAHITRYHKEE